MMQLFDNIVFMYTLIGFLFVLCAVLLFIIGSRNKQKNIEEDFVISTKIDIPNLEEKYEEKVDIENMLEQMQRDIEQKNLDDVRTFEDEQEQKSIISYQELLKVNKKDVIVENEQQKVNYIEDSYEEVPVKKFQTTEFISPIYGRLDNKAKYPTIPNFKEGKEDIRKEIKSEIKKEEIPTVNSNMELEKVLNLKALSEEIKRNDDFLNMLKEFRKNLE